jgi:hypothetical protein
VVLNYFFKNSEQCEEDSAKFICQQCDSIFCEKCFEVLHRSEKKKTHQKKELKEDFIPQKCSKHENKKLDFFCFDDKVKCCSLCLLYDHQNHKVIPISEATKIFKTKLSEMNFKEIYSDFEKDMKEIDKEITFKQKEIVDLQTKKQNKVDLLESVQKISNSIKQEENVDQISGVYTWKIKLNSTISNFMFLGVMILVKLVWGKMSRKLTNSQKSIKRLNGYLVVPNIVFFTLVSFEIYLSLQMVKYMPQAPIN